MIIIVTIILGGSETITHSDSAEVTETADLAVSVDSALPG